MSPVLLELKAPSKATALTIKNESDSPLTVQFRLFEWSQPDGEDQLLPANQLVISPPIASVLPRGEQVVRIVNVGNINPSSEQSYRLLVDELPSPSDRKEASTTEINVLLRYSLPVFILPSAGKLQPDPIWSLRLTDSRLEMAVTNKGNRRLRITDLVLESRDGSDNAIFGQGLIGYVLAGATRKWSSDVEKNNFVLNEHGTTMHLRAKTDIGEISEPVPLSVEK